MADLILSYVDGKVHLSLRAPRYGQPAYTHLTELDPKLALELGDCGLVFWKGNPIGHPIRPVILFTEHDTPNGQILVEVYECMASALPPIATAAITLREALAVVPRDRVFIIHWEGEKPDGRMAPCLAA